ncbi:hypothetical protein F511_19062 [Dorcoceras hygrometricum]|uniref:Uncharacterized protein n=1 Tax=Dorcoceras hygrometricum TaxID=472368 RepID=A0A2Z7CGL8_9LAMI|nr:hypothetical protein F511_19062 [Dorcoceras hygrometricum]
MKCKKHQIDPSGGVGVCASCLRERLVAIIAAQIQAQREAIFQQDQEDCRKSDVQLTPLVFHRSVSPYVSHRKSDSAATWTIQGHHRRFYSTPQVGSNGCIAVAVDREKKSNKGRFSSVLLGIFRSKSGKAVLDTGPVSVDSCAAAASPSWFSVIVPGRRKKQVQTFSVEEYSIEARRKSSRISDRGMSPTNVEDEEHCRDGSSGYSSESKKTPISTRRCKGRTPAQSRNASGFAFCLSPLVRPSPNWKWSQTVAPPDMKPAGEMKPHLSSAPSFCKNRSRKLADFGKQSSNPPYPIH